MAGYDIVIVGAGNLGLWTAWHLSKRGYKRIAVLERNWAGFGATSRSAGMVRQQGGSETAVKLGIWSRRLYVDIAREIGLDSGFFETGYYVVAETEDEKTAFEELVELRRRCGLDNVWLDREEARKQFPHFNWDRFLGATYTPNDGYVQPPIVARNITVAALKAGVEIHEQCEVQEIVPASSGYRVRTSRGEFEAERVLDAGGPRGSAAVAAMLDIDVPVSATRHLVASFPDVPAELPRPFPMFFVLAKGFYVRPDEYGAVVGVSNPDEQADPTMRFQLPFDFDFFKRMRPEWESAFPAIAGQSPSRVWAASIDYTPDHLPIIDEPRDGFFVLAAGGHGMMWGPALGMKMAELIDEERVSDLPADEIRLDRFARGVVGRDKIALPFPSPFRELRDAVTNRQQGSADTAGETAER